MNSLGEIEVGPESAGAQPGPACYGRGGTHPTITDACLLMGFLDPEEFVAGAIHLDKSLAQRAFAGLDVPLSMEERVRVAWEIGLNNVVEGVYNVGLRHGVDPRDYSLVGCGAAGPMLLPSLLGRSEFRRVIVPPLPGLFSALGLLCTDFVYSDSRSLYHILDPSNPEDVERSFTAIKLLCSSASSDLTKACRSSGPSMDASVARAGRRRSSKPRMVLLVAQRYVR